MSGNWDFNPFPSMDLGVKVEFTGGAELLFDNVKKHTLKLSSQEQPWTIRYLISWIRTHLLKERPELFVQGETVRPGILVLINDTDWELLGELDYDGDNVIFISSYTAWRCHSFVWARCNWNVKVSLTKKCPSLC